MCGVVYAKYPTRNRHASAKIDLFRLASLCQVEPPLLKSYARARDVILAKTKKTPHTYVSHALLFVVYMDTIKCQRQFVLTAFTISHAEDACRVMHIPANRLHALL